MEGIVAGMNDAEPLRDKKKKNQQRLLLEIKERIETESDELIELPRMIKKANEELLATGAHYCFERLANGDEQLKIVKQEIEELRSRQAMILHNLDCKNNGEAKRFGSYLDKLEEMQEKLATQREIHTQQLSIGTKQYLEIEF